MKRGEVRNQLTGVLNRLLVILGREIQIEQLPADGDIEVVVTRFTASRLKQR